MRRGISKGTLALLLATSLVPIGALDRALADQRCTPIAKVIDASKIPGNHSAHPDSENPDERYRDQLGLNCVPTYELDFAGAINDPNIPKGTCDPESPYDQVAMAIKADPDFYKACKRLKFTMGPLLVRPGMNDSLIHVTTFEHPMYNGYTLRWKPGLQAADGSVPYVQDLHLHHGTWIGGVNGPSAATGPFFATGEEQTILQFPKGYGWSMQGRSAWAMLYMLHNALPTTEAVYITYDIDYIATEDAQQLEWTDATGATQKGLRDLKSIWMDAGAGGNQLTADGQSVRTSSYSPINPIFNAQRGYGHTDDGAFWGLTGPEGSSLQTVPIENNAGTGKLVCTFPRENCAGFDSSQSTSIQQGIARQDVIGRATTLNDSAFGPCPELGENARCGVLINMGGHLHPGGLRDEVSVMRGGKIVPIHISDAVYWGDETYADPSRAGAPPVSWDLSMTGVLSLPSGNGRAKDAWKILVRPGDKLILNGVYDTAVGSAYDQMAIVMSWVHPGYEADAIDPFGDDVIFDAGWAEGPALTSRPDGLPEAIDIGCTPGTIRPGDPDAGPNGERVGDTVLCLRGNVTHGSMPSRQMHADCELTGTCPPLTSARVPLLDNTVTMQGFTYGQMDLGIAQTAGIPQVPLGETLRFENPDLGPMIWHTVTACPIPCTGPTSASYPYPASYDTPVDFDSTILGVGLGAGTAGASGMGVTSWEYTPPQKGVYTFFCRIHPFMRGAFDVV